MSRIITLKDNRSRSEFIIKDDADVNPNYFKPEDRFPKLAGQKQCDYIVEFSAKVLFIELKGRDFKKGISQLENTLVKLKSFYQNCSKCCFYVGRNIPSARTDLPKYKEKFFTKYKAKLITKTNKCNTRTSLILNCECKCID